MIFRRITRGIRRIARGIKKGIKGVINTVKSTIGKIAQTAMGLAQGMLGCMPFGRAMGGFCNQFMNNPYAMMCGASLGAWGAMGACCGGSAQLAQMAQQSAATQAWADPCGRNNAFQNLAYFHAGYAFAQVQRHHQQHHLLYQNQHIMG